MKRVTKLLVAVVPLLFAAQALAQTGKISGRVTDAASRDGLPGVNVSIEGTTQGSVSDSEGYYSIINVRPGTYAVRASFVGFTPEVVQNVRVNTGLTTDLNFQLRELVIGGEEVVVTAERPIVQLDVSANVVSLNPAEFENLPVAGVTEVIDLQAGIEPGLQFRGAGSNQLAFVVDGMNMRTGRDQNPFTNIAYTSLEEVQVQTGGFNAEYGNVRSGIINLTTKEPSRTRYNLDAFLRYQPKQHKAFEGLSTLPENIGDCGFGTDSPDPNCDNWYNRGPLDPETRLNGTAGVWDVYTQRQYRPFEGWNAIVDRLKGDGFDVTVDDMLEYYQYTHRKDNSPQVADYEADVTLGGPLVPGLGQKMGDLRFLASYRGTQNTYLIPQFRNHFGAQTVQGKIVSNPRTNMKLTVHGMMSWERGNNDDAYATRLNLYSGWIPRYPWQWGPYAINEGSERGDVLYSDATLDLGDVDHNMLGVSFTHTVNANTFYEVSVQNVRSKYRTGFAQLRDAAYICPPSGVANDGVTPCIPGWPTGSLYTDNFGRLTASGEQALAQGLGGVVCFGGDSDLTGDGTTTAYCAGEEPLGLSPVGGNLLTGESTGGHWSKARDTTDVGLFSGKFDLTSQVNRFFQLKTGAELIIGDYNVNTQYMGFQLTGRLEGGQAWERSPIQGAAYAQGKLEFQGMIANLGLRLDYFDANSQWWVFTPYDMALRGREPVLDEQLEKAEPDAQLFLSPRLGVSFPVTENSKLYFNYGHFRQMLNAFDVFGVQSTPDGGIDIIGNPDSPMPKTVSYELGFDQNLFDRFLLRISGYYKDVQAQSRSVSFNGLGAMVQYSSRRPWNYQDIRGAEITLNKMTGRYFRGFVNYTYLQTKSGNFGYSVFYENSFEMLSYLRTTTDYRQSAPIASPFARINLIFLTPQDFGPDMGGLRLLGDWRASLLGEWRSGQKFTWTGGGGQAPELQDNVQWRDYWNWNLRVTKNVDSKLGDLQLFVDIDNLMNRRHLWNEIGFSDYDRDNDRYMWSLHLPEDVFDGMAAVDGSLPFKDKTGMPYIWVPGNDRPGDFRKPGVEFQPIEPVVDLAGVTEPSQRAWYWEKSTGNYSRWNGTSWSAVPQDELDKVLDEKAYIDMPNLLFKTFLNPRMVSMGLRISL